MDSVRLQARRILELQNYIDAQSGGPGKGWLNPGKLALVQGIEVSVPLGRRRGAYLRLAGLRRR